MTQNKKANHLRINDSIKRLESIIHEFEMFYMDVVGEDKTVEPITKEDDKNESLSLANFLVTADDSITILSERLYAVLHKLEKSLFNQNEG